MTKLTESQLAGIVEREGYSILSDTGVIDMCRTEAHKMLAQMESEAKAAAMTKYRNTPVEIDSIRFDSKAEAQRCAELKLLEQAGKISNLRLQPVYKLFDKFTDNFGRKHRAAVYIGDFAYTRNGGEICEDVKGYPTAVFALKWKMAIRAYPDVRFDIVNNPTPIPPYA